MKLITTEHKIKLSENLEKKEFKIASNAKMANILSDRLYGNKIGAVIRELSTNAADAHIEAGNDRIPFEVSLPTWNNLEFIIRDFGPGMSHDKVMNLYTTYGESDKDNSNSVTGCFGLGSKVPFCYNTRTFTVDSWQNGEHRIYNCFRDEDNMPCIVESFCEKSDEPSGVKITIPCSKGDTYDFSDNSVNIYSYFDVKPQILRGDCKCNELEYKVKGNNWGLRKWSNDYSTKCRAIMGNVAYDIHFEDKDLTDSLRQIIKTPFDIFFKLGELDIEANREGLSYDKRTKINLIRSLTQIKNEICELVENKVANADSLWEARTLYYSLFNEIPKELFDNVNWKDVIWKGQKLFSVDMGRVDLSDFIRSDSISIDKHTKNYWKKTSDTKAVRYISCNGNDCLCINDLKRGHKGRAALRASTLESKRSVFTITFHDASVKPAVLLALGMNDDSIFSKSSELPSPTSNRNGRSNYRKSIKITVFDNTFNRVKNAYWKDIEHDINNGGLYVELCRYDINFDGRQIDPSKLRYILNHFEALGINVPPIYGMRPKMLKNVKRKSNWQCFFLWAQSQLNSFKGKYNEKEIEFAYSQLQKIKPGWNKNKLDFIYIAKVADQLNNNSLLKSYYEKYKKLVDINKQNVIISDVRSLASFFKIENIFNNDNYDQTSLVDLDTKVYKQYAMLNCLSSNDAVKECLDHVVKYVKNVDSGNFDF